MNRVVYILGAGFSAPLGLPVVSNFLERSKDMYFEHSEKFAHFDKVFSTIRDMSFAKNYYETDLLNIEEILSILEMRESLGSNQANERHFIQYIIDVIQYYTPPTPTQFSGHHWSTTIFGSQPWNLYGFFVSSILGHSFARVTERKHPNSIEYDPIFGKMGKFEYGVITLNYDTILEQIANTMHSRFRGHTAFTRPDIEKVKHSGNGTLAKLHGSVDTGVIIPPTWNKGLANSSILAAWQSAYELLKNTNHIRIIGYSLPPNDNYLKYLLRTAIMESEHVKTIDILCLDPKGEVEARYADFIKFKNWRFRNINVFDYLNRYVQYGENWPEIIQFDKLEEVHETFFVPS